MHGMAEIVWIALASTAVVAFCHWLKLPSLLGFLVVGVLLGPVGLGVVHDSHAIEFAAEIGVVFLLFTIGLEISISDLVRMARQVLVGGALQMGITALGVALLFGVMFGSSKVGWILGLLVVPSSTALVLRLMGDSGELMTPYGRLSLAILLMQDFAVVGFMLLLPMFAKSDATQMQLVWSLGKAGLVTAGIFVLGRFAFPWVLRKIVALRSREVFLLVTLSMVFGTAFLAGKLGLSLALGAFVAGIVVSESEFSHQMFAEVLPFRDILNGLFFVSVGLLLQADVVRAKPWMLLGWVVGLLLWKFVVVVGIAKLFRLSWQAAVFTGVALSQVGEFGLVMVKEATALKLITQEQRGMLIAASLVTMILTPLFLMWLRASWPKHRAEVQADVDTEMAQELDKHVILVGYGINGRNVARALQYLGVKFVVVEMNQQTVQRERENGIPICYGDATSHILLELLHVERARVFITAIADAAVTRTIVAQARHANPKMQVIARTRYIAEIGPLRELGADIVVPEEFETSIELFGRILLAYDIPEFQVDMEKRKLRNEEYKVLLDETVKPVVSWADFFSGLQIERVLLEDGWKGAEKTLGELHLRVNTGATVLAILRDEQVHSAPEGGFRLSVCDTLILAGDAQAMQKAKELLRDGVLGQSSKSLLVEKTKEA
ncbi:cation:proton antiporter [Myxococcota bacterium]|nr:cation:proton antiporter [Myxococcota bacterium]